MHATHSEVQHLAPGTPATQLQPGAMLGHYVEIETTTRTESWRAVVLLTSIEQREGYQYVGWANRQPGGGWDRTMGFWGYFRLYPEAHEYGTRIVRVLL
jgi:hypothetical protein